MPADRVFRRCCRPYLACFMLPAYRKGASLRTLCGRLFKCLPSQIFIAHGCEDSDPCGDSDTCAGIELNQLVLYAVAHTLCDDSDLCGSEQTTYQ